MDEYACLTCTHIGEICQRVSGDDVSRFSFPQPETSMTKTAMLPRQTRDSSHMAQ
ncbi:uncharacterized, partial [Tachysurus ichikawai]